MAIDSIAQIGFCETIPAAFLGLAASDKTTREESYWKIENVVVVQRELYEGAFFVVPFLLEMLRNSPGGKEEIYNLLFEIANGAAGFGDAVRYSVKEHPFVYYVPVDSGANEEPLSSACRSAVLKGIIHYVKDVEQGTLTVKEAALELLTSFTEHPYLIRSALNNVLRTEKDASFAEIISSAIESI